MKRFKLRELILKFPEPEGLREIDMAQPRLCNQVTLLECPNGFTGSGCTNATELPAQCLQVTLLECANGVTSRGCGRTLGGQVCQQVTMLECANGVTQARCDGRTFEGACHKVTFFECGVTNFGAAAPITPDCGTKNPHVPDCCTGCTHGRPCTDTGPTTYQGCGQDCGICTNNTPQCTAATDHCGACTHGTDDAALFVRTYDVDRMPLESLSVLQQQLGEILQRAKAAEAKFVPSSDADLDAAEAQLREGLEEIQRLKAERGGDR